MYIDITITYYVYYAKREIRVYKMQSPGITVYNGNSHKQLKTENC